MNLYESIFITRPSLMEEEVNRLGDRMRSMIEESGGSILKAENWGKKKLAYEVEKEKKGNYYFLLFQSDGKVIPDLERTYRLDDAVMKYLTVKLTKQDLAQREQARKSQPQTQTSETGAPASAGVDEGETQS